MLAEAATTHNGEERNAIYAQLEQKIADVCVWLPLSHQENLSAYLSNVHNYIAHPPGNVFLSQTYKQ